MMDDDDDKDEILKGLEGEVDDFAGDKLPPEMTGHGVTITISVNKPKEEEPEEEEGESKEVEDAEGEHDPIGHILGMCGGGCTK